MNVKEAGFIFVYLSYENASNNYVYFDDFKVTHTKSNIVQSNEYYPFGQLTAGSWTRENAADNRYLANGGTELNRTSNLYDLEYRNYDPVLGRLHQVDPMAAKYASVTPYNYSFNNAVNLNDPSGADPENQSHGMWFSGGHYTYDDVIPNKGGEPWSGRTGMKSLDPYTSGLDDWREDTFEFLGGTGEQIWNHKVEMRLDGDRVKAGRMTESEYGDKYGTAGELYATYYQSITSSGTISEEQIGWKIKSLGGTTLAVFGSVLLNGEFDSCPYLSYEAEYVKGNDYRTEGKLIWYDGNGDVQGSWNATSGSGKTKVTDPAHTIPRGTWFATSYEDSCDPSFTRVSKKTGADVGFKVRLSPDRYDENRGRYTGGILIHPARSGGTRGCIGLIGKDISKIQDFENRISEYISKKGSLVVLVCY